MVTGPMTGDGDWLAPQDDAEGLDARAGEDHCVGLDRSNILGRGQDEVVRAQRYWHLLREEEYRPS